MIIAGGGILEGRDGDLPCRCVQDAEGRVSVIGMSVTRSSGLCELDDKRGTSEISRADRVTSAKKEGKGQTVLASTCARGGL